MSASLRLILRLSVLGCALIAGAAPPAPPATFQDDTALSAVPEVRIRKLHLVRPDLILYPLAYEVVC